MSRDINQSEKDGRAFSRELLLSPRFLDLFVISFLSLFFELVCIRWVPGYVREIAYYTNLILLAAFFGLGLGLLFKDKHRRSMQHLFVAVAVLVGAVVIFRYVQVHSPSLDTFIWENFSRVNILSVNVSVTVILFFFLTTLCFVPIGQKIEACFEAFPPLVAYTINVGAAILGVAVFFILSLLSVPPLVWFIVSLLGFLYLARSTFFRNVLYSILILGAVYYVDVGQPGQTIWSPYYKISLMEHRGVGGTGEPGKKFFRLLVDDDFHQRAIPMDSRKSAGEYIAKYRSRYQYPYAFIKPSRVLILGAGMGNDASMALLAGAKKVDVVEIDPVILNLGVEHHPDSPYKDPRVTLYNDDARSHLKKSKKEYDLILFGTLDSHRLFSKMSSIRMDSFVYTKESLESAARLLAPSGILAITFVAHKDWIKKRFVLNLSEVFGQEPSVFDWSNSWTTILISKTGQHQIPVPWKYPKQVNVDPMGEEQCVDDWPYLYIKERAIPRDYWGILASILVLASALIYMVMPRPRGFDGHFFALGAGFLLLETKSITEFALLYGSTWVVNAVVFVSILSVILLANLLVFRVHFRRLWVIYALLGGSLLFNYFFDLRHLLSVHPYLELILGSVLIAMPIFFAAIIFARTFSKTKNVSVSLGSNLLGAVFGGLIEYLSLVFGLKALYLFSIGLYCISMVFLLHRRGHSPSDGSFLVPSTD